jgi:hypothetical protein
MAKVPSYGAEGGCECPGGKRLDLANRRNHCRLIYRLSIISAADSGGARRNQARRRRGDAVAKGARERRRRERASGNGDRSGGPSRWSGSTKRLAPTGGPGLIGGPRLAEREKRG